VTELSGYVFSALRRGEFTLYRGSGDGLDPILLVAPVGEYFARESLKRLEHEHDLKAELDADWAVRPVDLSRHDGRIALVLEDPGGEPLDRLLGAPMEVGSFLRLAIGITGAVGKIHQRGLIHKDIKPANILANCTDGQVRLTGFGVASRLQRDRQSPGPPETIVGTLAYMAPEQTGRMNRSIDSRSDLYSLGATLYQLLTGHLLFTAADPMDWVHCHIARMPVAPDKRLKEVPGATSAIVMKLLCKTPEERYQTAAGLESDLGRCLAAWEAERRIDDFPLGEHDTPGRLLIPEKLYGRADEVDALLAAFDRIVKGGAPELVLVSGYSGIGKSSLVNELHRVLVPPRGLFAAGKFDQYKRDIPYSTLVQAFQSLVRPLLSKSDAELASWRDALLEALGPNGRLMVDLVPELKFIIGEQPPVPELEPQQAQNRFQLVFRQLIGVFARPEHPLALFLDDLQWLDAATLNLLEDLLTRPDVRHLMLIGAYRDNEVDRAHPLMRKLEAIRKAGGKVQDIVLKPLLREDLGQLIADAIQCEFEQSAPLAELVHEKTNGNPFFAIQFVSTLAEEGLLTFDQGEARWRWDLNRIHARGYTDNVADLMAAKLSRLPDATQEALGQLACLGNVAQIATMTLVHGESEQKVHEGLWEAVRAGLVFRLGDSYVFLHDRVQEAAYALIPESERAATHLRIGRALVSRIAPEALEEVVFDVVNHLNRGAEMILTQEEREHVAELNLMAGKRAKNASAYASALKYLVAGTALLAEDRWERRYDLAFPLELHRAECEFLIGDLAAAEARLLALSRHPGNLTDEAAVTCLRMDLYYLLVQTDRAVAVCLEYLRRVGIEWSPHPTDEEVRQEYERMWRKLGDRTIEELIDLPLMSDPATLATMNVLTKLMPFAWMSDENLGRLMATRMVNLSLENGNDNASCCGYVWVGVTLGAYSGDYPSAFRFGQLSVDLVDKRGLDAFRARVYLNFGQANAWMRDVRSSRTFFERAFEAANRVGDLVYAGHCWNNLVTISLASGEPLGEVEREAVKGIDFARKLRFGIVVDMIMGQLHLSRMLRGLTSEFTSFNDAEFDEAAFEQHLEENPSLTLPAGFYWVRKLEAHVLANDYLSALGAAAKTQELLWALRPFFEYAEYHFYAGLAQAARSSMMPAEESAPHLEALAAHYRQLDLWARHCPENFADRRALLAAEIARLEERVVDAERLYEDAIRLARDRGFVQNEGLSNELASRFYAARGFETIAHAYLRNARSCYLRWGAEGKVKQLDRLHPHLAAAEGHLPTASIGSRIQHLDVASIVKASQAVSSEIILPKLIERLMMIALENAGADRGLLILPAEEDHLIQAEGRATGDQVEVELCQKSITGITCPESLVRYVIRTHESVILDDSSRPNPSFEDDYLRGRQAKSMLCLPLLKQGQLTGLLYLENTLTSFAFTPDRIAVLELLAAQAAISLENTRLYGDLQEREAKVRRLVDSNIIGIFIWDFEGRLIEANEAFLHMMGQSRDDLVSGRLSWSALTPNEWSSADERALAELRATGSCKPFEKEFFRKDGIRVPVFVGGATFGGRAHQGVAFVLDLTERKGAEAQAHESERRYREVQMELAHANRVATMGELTASIAHDVSQPIAATVLNAQVGLRFLDRRPPDLEEVRQALASIVKDGNRAGEVIGRIRALIKRAPARNDRLEINEAILEIVALTDAEIVRNGVAVQTELADGLPPIQGDRVELQQVILNLIINAIDAMSSVGEGATRELLISTGQAELGGVLVSVRDSGPGLAPSNLEHLFEAFYTTKPSGLGLGLSICRSIIEARGGRLWATANLPHGAVFQFTLPAYPDLAA